MLILTIIQLKPNHTMVYWDLIYIQTKPYHGSRLPIPSPAPFISIAYPLAPHALPLRQDARHVHQHKDEQRNAANALGD
jgi:hypothetical protein